MVPPRGGPVGRPSRDIGKTRELLQTNQLWLAYPKRLARLDNLSVQARAPSLENASSSRVWKGKEGRRGHTSVKHDRSCRPMATSLVIEVRSTAVSEAVS